MQLAILFRVDIDTTHNSPPTEAKRAISVGIVGGMTPITSSSLPALPPVDTFPVSLPNGTWHICSRRACREQCQSHYARGHGSGGHPYVPWPLAVVWLMWLLCFFPGWLCLWHLHDSTCEEEGSSRT